MQIIGHRGARGEAPENTLGGFQYLSDLGIRAVEFDVRQLANHELSVIHDDNFLRTAGLDIKLKDYAAQNSCLFNQTKGWETWHQVEPLPLLTQVMQILKDFNHIKVEVKSVDHQHDAEQLISKLQQQLQIFQERVTITSFDLKILHALKQQQSTFKRGLLVEMPIGEYAIDIAKQYDCCRIGWKDQLVNQSLVQRCHQENLEVSVWTVNSVERAKTLRDFGIQGLITDFPKKMINQL